MDPPRLVRFQLFLGWSCWSVHVWHACGEGVGRAGVGGYGLPLFYAQAHGMALRVFAVPWKGTAGTLYSGRVSRDRTMSIWYSLLDRTCVWVALQ